MAIGTLGEVRKTTDGTTWTTSGTTADPTRTRSTAHRRACVTSATTTARSARPRTAAARGPRAAPAPTLTSTRWPAPTPRIAWRASSRAAKRVTSDGTTWTTVGATTEPDIYSVTCTKGGACWWAARAARCSRRWRPTSARGATTTPAWCTRCTASPARRRWSAWRQASAATSPTRPMPVAAAGSIAAADSHGHHRRDRLLHAFDLRRRGERRPVRVHDRHGRHLDGRRERDRPRHQRISCPSATVCYASGVLGEIRKTTDGGATWTTFGVTGDPDLYGIDCPSTTVCVTPPARSGRSARPPTAAPGPPSA